MWKEIKEIKEKKKYEFFIGNYDKKRLWKIKVFPGIYISFNINYSIILIN